MLLDMVISNMWVIKGVNLIDYYYINNLLITLSSLRKLSKHLQVHGDNSVRNPHSTNEISAHREIPELVEFMTKKYSNYMYIVSND